MSSNDQEMIAWIKKLERDIQLLQLVEVLPAVRWVSWSPTWTSTGAAPVLNNGTLVGRVCVIGKLIRYNMQLTMGAGTTYGTGSYRFSLPYTVGANALSALAWVTIYDQNVAQRYLRYCRLGASDTYIQAGISPVDGSTATDFSPTVPITFAAGDILRIDGSYEVG